MPTPPAGFTIDQPQAITPPPGFKLDTSIPTAPKQDQFTAGMLNAADTQKDILSGSYHRAIDLLKGLPALVAPPSGTAEHLSGPALPAYRIGKSAIQSGKEAIDQARQYTQEANEVKGDPITRLLLNLRAGTAAASALNPLVSGSVTNINRLEDQGRNREAFGQGGTDIILNLLGLKSPKAIETTSHIVQNPLAPVRILGQEFGGAGKEAVLKANRARNESIADITERNAGKKADYVQKEFAARQGERASEAVNSQRQVIQRGQKEYARLIGENLRQTQKSVKGALDSRWNKLSEQMEKPRKVGDKIQTAPVDGRPIRDSIQQAQNQYLVGSPEDLKAFKDLMGRLSDPNIESGDYTKPLGWNEARTHFTNINDRLYSGSLTPNVYQALRLVRDSLDEQLGRAAQARGLGNEYTALKRDWSQYKGDFDDLSNMSTGGGSPLARAIRFQSPADLENLLNSRYSDNLLQRVSRYQDRGANPRTISTYRELGKKANALQNPKIPAHPTRPPLQSLPPEIVPYELRLRKLEEFSGRPASIYDLYPVRAIERLALKSPAMREWIARQPRKELQP